jgi:hypothetical protein
MAESSVFEDLYQEELYIIAPSTLILVDKAWCDITDEEKVLLNKILGSVKLSLATVIVQHRQDASVNDLLPFNIQRLISFGVTVSPVQKQYEYVPLDGLQIIVADGLSELDDSRKKNLWLALRQMFGI